MYYVADGAVEMYDIKNRRTFLKKVVYPSVTIDQLYLGSTITVFARQLNIVEYADEYTKSQLEKKRETTFAMIKPKAVKHAGKILNAISKSGFVVSKLKMIHLSVGEASAFYGEHQGKPFFRDLIAMITSGPVVAMELVAERGITKWRDLLGPTNHEQAVLTAPQSIRAKFGTSTTDNACHGSSSTESAAQELAFFFGKGGPKAVSAKKGCTCAIIKPHAVVAGYAGQVLDKIMESFNVTAAQMFSLSRPNAMEFYEVYKGVVPEYNSMVEELTSGPFIALELTAKSGENPVESFRELCGPLDPEIARLLRPKSLRALFGVDKVRNAVHCTDLVDDGVLESHYFFGILN